MTIVGNLWAAMYGGVGRLDPTTGHFVMYTPENQNTIQYQKILEDNEGFLWLGAQSGLHRFDPRTGQFKIYEHNPDDPDSLSDNRVNSVLFDQRVLCGWARKMAFQDSIAKRGPSKITMRRTV